MDREKCMKIVIEQLNQIKPLMSIDPEVSLLPRIGCLDIILQLENLNLQH